MKQWTNWSSCTEMVHCIEAFQFHSGICWLRLGIASVWNETAKYIYTNTDMVKVSTSVCKRRITIVGLNCFIYHEKQYLFFKNCIFIQSMMEWISIFFHSDRCILTEETDKKRKQKHSLIMAHFKQIMDLDLQQNLTSLSLIKTAQQNPANNQRNQ